MEYQPHPEYNKFMKFLSIYHRILGGHPKENDLKTLFMSRNDFIDAKIKEVLIIFSNTNIESDYRYQLDSSNYLFDCIQQTQSFTEALISYQLKRRSTI